MVRKYNYSEYFSSIIGYTGRISDEEYRELYEKDKTYTPNDIIGRRWSIIDFRFNNHSILRPQYLTTAVEDEQ